MSERGRSVIESGPFDISIVWNETANPQVDFRLASRRDPDGANEMRYANISVRWRPCLPGKSHPKVVLNEAGLLLPEDAHRVAAAIEAATRVAEHAERIVNERGSQSGHAPVEPPVPKQPKQVETPAPEPVRRPKRRNPERDDTRQTTQQRTRSGTDITPIPTAMAYRNAKRYEQTSAEIEATRRWLQKMRREWDDND